MKLRSVFLLGRIAEQLTAPHLFGLSDMKPELEGCALGAVLVGPSEMSPRSDVEEQSLPTV